MSRKRFLALPALVLAVGLVAGPADASRQDSWLGNPFMWHINDVIAFPHRAAQDDWQNEAAAIFVPNSSFSSFPGPRGSEAAEALLQGTATFGRDNWGIIVAANDNRGYNPVKAIGAGYDPRFDGSQLPDSRRPADYLTMPTSAYFSTYGLGGNMAAVMPRTRMQIGLGYGLDAVDLGLFWTNAASQNTTETNDGAGNTTKTGTEAGYNSFTLSGGLNLSAFTSFELALSFTTGSQERFGTVGTNPGVGTGDNSAFALTWQGHLDRSWLGWAPAVIFTYGQCSADFSETLAAGATPPADKDELETSSMRIDLGGKRSWTKADVAVDLGFQLETTKNTFTQGGGGTGVGTDETTHTLFPVCGASGTYWPWGWFGIDGGVLFVFDSVENKDEANPGGGGAVSTDTDNDISMDSEFGFGLVFRIARETWGADFAANVRNDVLSDPGTLFQGGFGSAPIFAIESALHW